MIDTNLNGSFYMCQTFAQRMIALGQGGAIINISTPGTQVMLAGTGEDIANMVAFLCSEQGAWISGQNIYVDGGYTNVPLMGN